MAHFNAVFVVSFGGGWGLSNDDIETNNGSQPSKMNNPQQQHTHKHTPHTEQHQQPENKTTTSSACNPKTRDSSKS